MKKIRVLRPCKLGLPGKTIVRPPAWMLEWAARHVGTVKIIEEPPRARRIPESPPPEVKPEPIIRRSTEAEKAKGDK